MSDYELMIQYISNGSVFRNDAKAIESFIAAWRILAVFA